MTETRTDPPAVSVGWSGAGRMGAAMATRLALAGSPVDDGLSGAGLPKRADRNRELQETS